MKLETAINFMMYSYFNLTLEDGKSKERVLKASIERAYLDATQQGAYNTQLTKNCEEKGKEGYKDCKKCVKKDSEECMKKKSVKAKGSGTKKIKEAIENLLKNDGVNFERWHGEICDDLLKIYKKVNHNVKIFNYGNAQKWVNMSLKYLCILNKVYNDKDSGREICKDIKNIDNYEEHFHIPVDRYMIKAVKENSDIKWPDGKKDVKAWSKWEKEDEEYTKFQKSLEKSLKDAKLLGDSPLDWENKQWIKIARAEKEEKLAKKK